MRSIFIWQDYASQPQFMTISGTLFIFFNMHMDIPLYYPQSMTGFLEKKYNIRKRTMLKKDNMKYL